MLADNLNDLFRGPWNELHRKVASGALSPFEATHLSNGETEASTPRTDIFETTDGLILVAEMPGVNEAGVSIKVEERVLTIEGRVDAPAPEGYSLSYGERRAGGWRRTFRLSTEVDLEGITAEVKDGLVRVLLPKSEASKPRQIVVKAG